MLLSGSGDCVHQATICQSIKRSHHLVELLRLLVAALRLDFALSLWRQCAICTCRPQRPPASPRMLAARDAMLRDCQEPFTGSLLTAAMPIKRVATYIRAAPPMQMLPCRRALPGGAAGAGGGRDVTGGDVSGAQQVRVGQLPHDVLPRAGRKLQGGGGLSRRGACCCACALPATCNSSKAGPVNASTRSNRCEASGGRCLALGIS